MPTMFVWLIPVALLPLAAAAQTPPTITQAAPAPGVKWMMYPDGKLHPQAPVGHRQPGLADLPPDLARREKRDAPILSDPDQQGLREGDIDPALRICRGC